MRSVQPENAEQWSILLGKTKLMDDSCVAALLEDGWGPSGRFHDPKVWSDAQITSAV